MEPYAQFAPVVLKLLQGPVYADDRHHWSMLLNFQAQVQRYLGQIGLHLHLNEGEGFAYLSQPDQEEGEMRLPRLIRRKALSYEVTLLLVLLREALEEFDVKEVTVSTFYISNRLIVERTELFLKEKSDRVKLLQNIEHYIQQVVDLGFLKKVETPPSATQQLLVAEEQQYEVKRIIKDKINTEKLEEIRNQLQTYGESVQS